MLSNPSLSAAARPYGKRDRYVFPSPPRNPLLPMCRLTFFLTGIGWLLVCCAWADAQVISPVFTYERQVIEHRKDAVFEDFFSVTLAFDAHYAGRLLKVFRGPSQILGVRGKLRVFSDWTFESDPLPNELEEMRRTLDGLSFDQIPDPPKPDNCDKCASVRLRYGEISRTYVLRPDDERGRKIDEAVERLVKKQIDRRAVPFWQWPEQRVFPGDEQPVREVAVTELVTDPMKFHGQRVRVHGYYRQGFEVRELSDKADSNERVWVGGRSAFSDNRNFDRLAAAGETKAVVIEGTFDATKRGHMDGFCGSIERTTRCVLAGDKTEKKTR